MVADRDNTRLRHVSLSDGYTSTCLGDSDKAPSDLNASVPRQRCMCVHMCIYVYVYGAHERTCPDDDDVFNFFYLFLQKQQLAYLYIPIGYTHLDDKNLFDLNEPY